ncbi:MAG: response regulator transcription factor [Bacteroidia bacterium]|nr:response regulator transcription factor [Bacteroidia bacterium]
MEETKKNKIRLLLVDDHQIVIDGIKNLLRKSEEFWVVGEFQNGYDALEFLQENRVDLMITDLQMPSMSGIELCQKVKEQFQEVKILVLSMHHDPDVVRKIFASHAEGYILKNTDRKELKDAIYQLVNGGTYYSREVLQSMLGEVISKEKESQVKLSPREIEILQLIAEEHTTPEIAEKLFISPRTVETHRKHLMQKSGSKSVVGLIMFGLKTRIITLN